MKSTYPMVIHIKWFTSSPPRTLNLSSRLELSLLMIKIRDKCPKAILWIRKSYTKSKNIHQHSPRIAKTDNKLSISNSVIILSCSNLLLNHIMNSKSTSKPQENNCKLSPLKPSNVFSWSQSVSVNIKHLKRKSLPKHSHSLLITFNQIESPLIKTTSPNNNSKAHNPPPHTSKSSKKTSRDSKIQEKNLLLIIKPLKLPDLINTNSILTNCFRKSLNQKNVYTDQPSNPHPNHCKAVFRQRPKSIQSPTVIKLGLK